MKKKIIEMINQFISDKEITHKDLKNIEYKINEKTRLYHNETDISKRTEIVEELVACYNQLYYIKFFLDRRKIYYLGKDTEFLSSVFIVDQKPKRFVINIDLLTSINLSNGLTEEQALELLRWTANNTRDSINIENRKQGKKENVYQDGTLDGICGFS